MGRVGRIGRDLFVSLRVARREHRRVNRELRQRRVGLPVSRAVVGQLDDNGVPDGSGHGLF